MIPLKLTLKNFMSYGEAGETLLLEEMHVACLSGDNGNGKSSLLDALTWALWGKTRASSVKSVTDDDLIRLGADEMEVRLEFALDGQRYRVVRKRKRGKTGGSEWQLAQAGANGHYIAIGSSNQRDTGRQIVQLLNMEYDTFLNSAYLQQGRADEFTRQTPDQRKAILAEILDLDRYDRLEARAKELFKERREQAAELEGQMRLLHGQIAQLPEVQTRWKETLQALDDVQQQTGEQEKQTEALRERRGKLDALANTVVEREESCRGAEKELGRLEEEQCERVSRLKTIQNRLDQKEAIVRDQMALQAARARREKLEPEVEAFNKTNAELQNVIGAIDIERTKLAGELRLLENRWSTLEQRRQESADLETQRAALERALRMEPEVLQELARVQAQQEAHQQEFSELSARNRELGEQIQEIEEVLELLARPQAACPVCDSDLSGKKQVLVLQRQQTRREQRQAEREAVQKAGRECKQLLTADQEQIARLSTQRDALAAQRGQVQQIRERHRALQAELAEAEQVRVQRQALQAQIEREEYAAPQRVRRRRLEVELERLRLAKAEHEAVTQQMHRLEPARERYQELQQAEGQWNQVIVEKQRLDKAITEKQQECARLRAGLKELQSRLSEHEAVQRETVAAEINLARLQQEANNLRVSEGTLQRYIAQCEQAAQEHKQLSEQVKQVEEERRIYNGLAIAFGKKGVQALIIENAIPELQEEANALLARITDNAMQVSFETTRTGKTTQSEIETLDIKITDDMGARPYELFSGGEAFRVNFAIRIALSRLLARRSGAKLQTLILDEGFGTQDGKGREKLIEAIEMIKDDFQKILVITHVEELKDAFVQRIEVTKDADGSHLHVM